MTRTKYIKICCAHLVSQKVLNSVGTCKRIHSVSRKVDSPKCCKIWYLFLKECLIDRKAFLSPNQSVVIVIIAGGKIAIIAASFSVSVSSPTNINMEGIRIENGSRSFMSQCTLLFI